MVEVFESFPARLTFKRGLVFSKLNRRGLVVNRKLIRTTLAEVRERVEREGMRRALETQRKRVPPEQTHAETYYYKKQMENKTPMVIVLQDGEELRGTIEWYDRNCIKLHRTDAPNLLILKHNIKYMYKDIAAKQQEEKQEEVPQVEEVAEEAPVE
jgi:host factor-I protein